MASDDEANWTAHLGADVKSETHHNDPMVLLFKFGWRFNDNGCL